MKKRYLLLHKIIVLRIGENYSCLVLRYVKYGSRTVIAVHKDFKINGL